MNMTEELLFVYVYILFVFLKSLVGFASDECTKAERTGNQCSHHAKGYRSPEGILLAALVSLLDVVQR